MYFLNLQIKKKINFFVDLPNLKYTYTGMFGLRPRIVSFQDVQVKTFEYSCYFSDVLVKIMKKVPHMSPSAFHYFSKNTLYKWRCPWCNGYRRRNWTRRHEFKSWTSLITFHIALIPLEKVWIQLFSLQLWVNSRAD